MEFPRFPNGIKTHMPFVTIINGIEYYLCCMSNKDNGLWKIYIYRNGSWNRLTNNSENVIECNPVLNRYYGKYIVSFCISGFNVDSGMVVLEGTNFEELKEKKFIPYILSGYDSGERSVYVANKNNVNFYKNGQMFLNFKFVDVDYVYKCGFVPGEKDKVIFTCKIKDKYINCLYDLDKFYKVCCDDVDAYKFCKFKDEYWYTLKLNGEFENRYICKAKTVLLKEEELSILKED